MSKKKKGQTLESMNKGFSVPDTYIIIFFVVCLAALLTYLIPQGLYETEDSIRVFIRDDGIIIIEETHHDSPVVPNHYEIRVVTNKGLQLINKKEDALSRRELHQLLLNTPGCVKSVVTKSKIKEMK